MTEDQIQIKVNHHFKSLEAALGNFFYYAVPNGGKRDVREASKLKAMGVRPGVADMVFLGEGGKTVFIELKAAKGVLSDSQKLFHGIVTRLGFASYTIPAKDGYEAIQRIESVLKVHGVLTV